MLITFLLGFSSGLPLQLTGATLKFWLSEANVDITTIGYFGWVGMAYSLKFIWAPLADRYSFFGMGRRRSWMVLSQIAIAIGLVVVGVLDPKESLVLVAAVSVWIAFFSATQDIAYDAFRREYLDDKELGFGSSMNMYGYRIGMLISSGVALGMAAYMSWTHVYWIMAVLMGVGIGTTLYSKESRNVDYKSKTLRESVIEPFKEFIQRNGAILILLFVFFFKLGDALSGSMLSPFYKEMGYQKEDIALIAKTFGLISSMLGLFIGGITIYKIGILRSLWIFGILQALSTASFALITYTGPEKWALAFAVIFEDITAGMGSSAFIAYLASITNRNYTATQFAVLSSIATLGRNFFSGFSGVMVKEFGWEWFFYSCALIALPGMGFLYWVQKSKFQKVGSPTEEILSKI
jgi:PAT family beta-lactamase induction signal transducer AmpG